MATAKVTINGNTILDLTDATASASEVLSTYTAYGSDGSKITGQAVVSPTLQSKTKTYTPTTSQQTETISADNGYDGLDEVAITVNAIPNQYIVPSGNKSITQNGSNIDVTEYASVDVAVSSSDFIVTLSWDDDYFDEGEGAWIPDKTATEINAAIEGGKTISTLLYLPDQTYATIPDYRISNLYVNQIDGDFHYSVDIFYLGTMFEAPKTVTLSYALSRTTNTVRAVDEPYTTWDTSSSSVNASEVADGDIYFDEEGQKVGTASINSSSDLTVNGATVTAPAGFYASDVTKTVASGTAGTPTATKGTVSNHSISVTPSVTNTTGYIEGSTKTGTAVTVSASELVSGTLSVTSSGTKDVTNYASASIPSLTLPSTASSASSGTSKATISRSTSAQYINIPTGFNDTAQYYTVSATPNGTVTAPSTITGTSATVSTGTNTLTLTKTVSVTPSVTTAGYISSGTAGNASVSLTASVTTKAAATITPTTTNQTIASGTYLTGAQTIAGDSNLVSSNIISGKSIFGVNGSVSFVTYYTGSSAPSSSTGTDGDIYLRTN